MLAQFPCSRNSHARTIPLPAHSPACTIPMPALLFLYQICPHNSSASTIPMPANFLYQICPHEFPACTIPIPNLLAQFPARTIPRRIRDHVLASTRRDPVLAPTRRDPILALLSLTHLTTSCVYCRVDFLQYFRRNHHHQCERLLSLIAD